MESLLPLIEMGFELDQVHCAFEAGCKTTEEAIAFLLGETGPIQGHLVLGPRALQPTSMFSPRAPDYIPSAISPTHPSQNRPDDMEVDREPTSPVPSVKSRITISEDAIEFQKSEMAKQAERMRQEKLARANEKERIRSQIEQDRITLRERQRIASQNNPTTSQPDAPSSRPTVDERPCSTDTIHVRVFWEGRSSPIGTLSLSSSTTYGEFLSSLQNLIGTRHHHDSGSTEEPSIQVTDPCIHLLLTSWPRKLLPHCSSVTSESLSQQPIIGFGLMDGVGVCIRHSPNNCSIAPPRPPEGSITPPESSPPERSITPPHLWPAPQPGTPPNDSPQPSPPNSPPPAEHDPRFPIGGQQLVPRPPHAVVPPSSLNLRELIRRGAQNLEINRQDPVMEAVEDLHTVRTPLSLVQLSLYQVISMLKQYSDILTISRVGLDPSQRISPVVISVMQRFAATPLPTHLGQRLISALCAEDHFDPVMASILRNCVTQLDLSSYPLVSCELIMCLIEKWTQLVELRLDHLQIGQLKIDTIRRLNGSKNLRVLSLRGLNVVCDANIAALADLPELRVLRVSQTSVTDEGWVSLSGTVGADNGRPLVDLEVAGMEDRLTNRGLRAICVAFPNLRRLNVARCLIGSDRSQCVEPLKSLDYLAYVDVSGCGLLSEFPPQLIPPSVDGSGLIEVKLAGCNHLDFATLLVKLNGHPIRRFVGIETLNNLDASQLHILCDGRFPLCELNLRTINSDWMTESPMPLLNLLEGLQQSSLRHLSLPQRPIHNPQGDQLADALRRITRFIRLEYLDLGAQLRSEAELNVLIDLMDELPYIRNLVIFRLARNFEEPVRELCAKFNCTVHIQNVTD